MNGAQLSFVPRSREGELGSPVEFLLTDSTSRTIVRDVL
jgi:hypothetical protein